jgi:hypothetical protein
MNPLGKPFFGIHPRLEMILVSLWEPYPTVIDGDVLAVEVSAFHHTVGDFGELLLLFGEWVAALYYIFADDCGVSLVVEQDARHIVDEVVQVPV